MRVPRNDIPAPEEDAPECRPGPLLVPGQEKPGGRRGWWLLGAIGLLVAGGVVWMLRPAAGRPEAARGAAQVIRTATTKTGVLQETLVVSGTTAAFKYVTIRSPRLRGSRSRRGATLSGASIGVKSNITVSSTSSISPASTMSSLSRTGLVASSSSAASRGGGFESSGSSGSSQFRAATSRLGGTSRKSGGNIISSAGSSATAMGSSGLGTTATKLPGGSSGPPSAGSMRRRGDFHLVLQKLVPPGSKVKAGDVIAEFDRQYMLTRLDDYRASVAQHEANLRKNEADIEVNRVAHEESVKAAEGDLEKAKLDIKASPVLSAIQKERLKLALEESKAEYDQLRGEVPYIRVSQEADLNRTKLEVDEARLELHRAENNVDKLLVKAPLDGMTVMLNTFRNGEFGQVREGDQLWRGQPFMQVVDTSSMIVNAKVNQVDVEKVRIGLKAKVHFEAFPDLELPAHVYSIGTVAKAGRYRREYVTEVPVVLMLERTDPRVIPDLSVRATVILKTHEKATLAPLGAVFAEAGGARVVYVRESSGWLRQPVEMGARNHLWAIIRSGIGAGKEIAMDRPPGEAIRN